MLSPAVALDMDWQRKYKLILMRRRCWRQQTVPRISKLGPTCPSLHVASSRCWYQGLSHAKPDTEDKIIKFIKKYAGLLRQNKPQFSVRWWPRRASWWWSPRRSTCRWCTPWDLRPRAAWSRTRWDLPPRPGYKTPPGMVWLLSWWRWSRHHSPSLSRPLSSVRPISTKLESRRINFGSF